jgi:DNA repair exonuclease SbcCD ATPase subunit
MPETAMRSSVRPLAERAAELKRLAERCEATRAGAQQLEQLQTRVSELEALATRAAALADALTYLDPLDRVQPVAREDLSKVRTRVQALRDRVDRQGISVLLKPKALESLGAEDTLRDLEKRAREAWRENVLGGLGAGGLEAVLSRYRAYQAAAMTLAAKRVRLGEIAAGLPTAIAVAEVDALRAQFAETVAHAVAQEGLSERVVAFLGRATAGVSLAEVLGDADVLAWLQDRAHAAGFQVRAS